MDFLVQKLSEEAILPEKAYDSDAGFDFFSRTHIKLFPNERHLVSTGIAIKLPEGYCGVLKDRSGNATKKGLHVLAGIIDNGYTGHIKICLINLSIDAVTINIGDKISQMLILPVPAVKIVEVKELPNTTRGESGFGSTN